MHVNVVTLAEQHGNIFLHVSGSLCPLVSSFNLSKLYSSSLSGSPVVSWSHEKFSSYISLGRGEGGINVGQLISKMSAEGKCLDLEGIQGMLPLGIVVDFNTLTGFLGAGFLRCKPERSGRFRQNCGN